MAPPQLSLKGRALRLLSGREHSRAELERKLARYEETPGSLAQALNVAYSSVVLVHFFACLWCAGSLDGGGRQARGAVGRA